MQKLKWLGVAAGAFLGLVVVAIAVAVLVIEPNDYRDEIEHIVEEQTSRQFTLAGDLELSVFPWLAVQVGPAELSDAPGFGDEPFVALQQASLSVRFWPLLRGQVEIGKIRLEGVSVRLITDAQGRDNWADLAATDDEAAPSAEGGSSLASTTLAGLEIGNATVSYEDRRDNSRVAVRELSLTTGALESGKPFELTSRFLLEQSSGLSAQTEIAARVTPDLEMNVYVIDEPSLEVTLLGADYPEGGMPFKLAASRATLKVADEQHGAEALTLETTYRGEGLPAAGVPLMLRVATLQADLKAQTLALTGLDLDAAGARVTGQLNGSEILDAPRLSGPLSLATVSLREWLPKLGVEVPVTRDQQALKSLAFTADVAVTPSSAEFQKLNLKLDDTTATGTFGVTDFEAQALRFALEVDRIDADRYLAPEAPNEAAATMESAPVEIPVDMLRSLNVRGTLALGEAVLGGIKFSKLRLGVTARDGDVRLNPAEATVYGGQYRGNIGIAAASDVARVTLEQRLTDVNFAPLFKDMFDTSRLSGKGGFSSQLAASGRDSTALMKTLDGTLDFAVNDGALEGADLWYEIRRARALLKRQVPPARTGAERTEFTALKGSGTVKNGILESNDLTMAMQYLRVAGKATIDLPQSEIDSRIEATVLKIPAEGADAAGMQELVDARIPVRITGPLADPKVVPDVESYIKNEVKEKVEEKIRDTIQDRLRRALGR